MKKVLVPMANGMEEMEAIIIIDVLRRGGVEVVAASLHDDVATLEKSGYTGQSVQKNDSLKIITGKGPGAAFAFAKEILELLEGDKVRNQVQSGLQLA